MGAGTALGTVLLAASPAVASSSPTAGKCEVQDFVYPRGEGHWTRCPSAKGDYIKGSVGDHIPADAMCAQVWAHWTGGADKKKTVCATIWPAGDTFEWGPYKGHATVQFRVIPG